MAKSAGVSLGKLQSLSEGGGGFRQDEIIVTGARAAMSMDAAPTQVSGGEQSLTVTVNMTYAIQN